MSTLRLEKKIAKLKERHDVLLGELLRGPPMIRGSFSCVSTRCGKATCWCAKSEQGHRHNRMTWSEQGHMTTRKVPEEDIERIRELTGSYRRFKNTKRELKQVQKLLLETITTLESNINEQTRKPLSYLALAPKTVSSPEKSVRKSSSKTKSGS